MSSKSNTAKVLDSYIDGIWDKDLPIDISTSYGIHKDASVLHCHYCIEVCYIKEGQGIYIIGGRKYSFVKGDVFIINSDDVHLAYDTQNVVMQVLLFRPEVFWNGISCSLDINYLKPFWEAGKFYENRLNVSNAYYHQIVDTLLELEHESTHKENGHKLMMKSLIFKLASILTRYLDIKQDDKLPNEILKYNRFQPLFDYIEKNYSNKILLEDMAVLMNMSIAYFGTVFKNVTGISPTEYLIRKRIVEASKLLVETDRKIIDIAENCGFTSMSNFLVCFKRYVGKVPKDFRKIKE